MMEGLGKERSPSKANPFPWLSQPKTEASTLLWKLKDCFSSIETTGPHLTDKENSNMESRKTVLELKDVPPPPHHTSSQSSHSPKVSICTHCDYCSTDGQRVLDGGGFVGSSINNDGLVSLLMAPRSLRAPISNSSFSSSGSGLVTSSIHQYKNKLSCGSVRSAPDHLLSLDYPPQLRSAVATSQPVSSHPNLPCCSGLLHTCSSLPPPCSQPSIFPSLAPLASSLPSAFSAPPPSTLGDHPTSTTITTTTTSAHFCSNPMHLNVERTVFLKGAHYCQECFLKNSIIMIAVWPNVPVPHIAPITIPICNGCGTSSEGMIHMPSTSVGKTGQKFGSPESNGPENIPPVGVFWDIENCSVPSGRSAGAVVQRIRSRFFQGHREAEFICVCDISKESKAVIQELNNCQVTVAHINATAKNAADDKLRQSLRRFAETHTAPATVILVSSDVNFASELSDLRHRHGFQVILIHGNHTSPALLQHCHRHVTFQEMTADLPPRMLPSFNLLYVHNLPVNCDKNLRNAVKLRLRRLSDNCGGKVLGMSQGTAVLRFSSPEAASRARKRMENEDVFGHRISVSFSPRPRDNASPEPELQSQPLSLSRAAPQLTPLKGPTALGGGAVGLPVVFQPSPIRSAVSPVPASASAPLPCLLVWPAFHYSNPCSVTESPMNQGERGSGEFQISTPSAFSKLNLHRSFSPLVLSQGSWSSRSASPCLSSRSSPILTVSRSPCPESQQEPFSEGAEIQVGNLDYRMSRKDLQQMLHDGFARYGRVKAVELSPHTDYQLKATVHMLSLQQAISAVSGLHRYKIGGKRIQVSLTTGGGSKSLVLLSSEIITILQDAPASCLPLFKFTEIYEKKYSRKLVVGDLYRLPEVVAVREQGGSRLVCLLPSSQIRQSPLGSSQSQEGSSASGSPVVFEELEYHEPVCKQHYGQDFSEADFDPDSYKIPFVVMSLRTLASEVHSLLQEHDGTLPLLSFPDCYEAKFSPLQVGGETLHGGVSLEHLITCVPSITIVTAQNGFKVIKWVHNKPPTLLWIQRCKSPVGNPQLIQFSREIIDLLKSQPSCMIPISKFIPSYHHHFAKQCRVSDYGYTKLLELLEAVPHVLQILGMGTKRLLTLTHRAQLKRFTQDLLKLLKFQASKQVAINDFMQAYHWSCKLSYYGFTKLMELFEAIPEVLMVRTKKCGVLECGEEKMLSLTEVERIKALAAQLVKLLRAQKSSSLLVSQLLTEYSKTFGYALRLQDYDANSLPGLLTKLCHVVKVVDSPEGREVQLINRKSLRLLTSQLLSLLMSQEEEQVARGMKVENLSLLYLTAHGVQLNPCEYGFLSLSELLKSLPYLVEVTAGHSEEWVRLTRLYQFARNMRALLHTYHYNQIFLTEFQGAYDKFTGCSLEPRCYGYSNVDELLSAIPQVVWIKGHGHKRIIVLKNDMKGTVLFLSNSPQPEENTETLKDDCISNTVSAAHSPDSELLCLSSPVDLLCGPVPSCLPSPQLHPDPVLLQHTDLIYFEERTAPPTGQFVLAIDSYYIHFYFLLYIYVIIFSIIYLFAPNMKTLLSTESPGRRASRSRFKLAANFSITTGV
uniref:Meiosis regulator and mRNA stability factor 1 n=1 Tax=Cynoglossus semilaevis TaxID=244447 RepID=A0A3P8VU90_CYNSE